MLNENQTQNHKGGVKTEEGKAVSKYNAQKHCILRETPTIYENVDVEALYNDLSENLKPEDRIQETIIEIVANNMIKLQRIAKAEAEAILESMTEPKWRITADEHIPDVSTYYTAEKLLLYSRYQTATENRLYRALQAFKQMKHE